MNDDASGTEYVPLVAQKGDKRVLAIGGGEEKKSTQVFVSEFIKLINSLSGLVQKSQMTPRGFEPRLQA